MGAIWQDLRYALRGIARAPFLSFALLLALLTGIGLNCAVFAVLDEAWFRAPVEKNPASFLQVIPSYAGWFETENQFHGFTVNDYEAIRTQTKSLQEVAGFSGGGNAKLDSNSAEAGLALVTCNFFDTYGWTLVKGRFFLPQECSTPGSAPVVVVSETLWRTRYDADPLIAGKTIHINQHPYTVVGVVRFRSPIWMKGGLWIPYTMQPQVYLGYDGFKEHPDYPWLSVFGRLKPGYSQTDAQAELSIIQRQQDALIAGRKTLLQVTNGSIFQDPQFRSLGFLIVPLVMGPMVLILLVDARTSRCCCCRVRPRGEARLPSGWQLARAACDCYACSQRKGRLSPLQREWLAGISRTCSPDYWRHLFCGAPVVQWSRIGGCSPIWPVLRCLPPALPALHPQKHL